MDKKIIQTTNAPSPIGPYSQAVMAGNLLFISGQIPLNAATGEMETGSIENQTKLVMKNLESILSETGLTFSNVVKTCIFLKSMSDFPKVNEVYGSYFTAEFPARETVEVSQLPKGASVEISMIASV